MCIDSIGIFRILREQKRPNILSPQLSHKKKIILSNYIAIANDRGARSQNNDKYFDSDKLLQFNIL